MGEKYYIGDGENQLKDLKAENLTPVIKEIIKLRQQIEVMKCCGNCLHEEWAYQELDCMYSYGPDSCKMSNDESTVSYWELRE